MLTPTTTTPVRLVRWAERRSDVLGVVALGSTAATDHRPDRYSDHDLFVVTVDGAAQALRDDVGWLPDAHRIALCHTETRHGRGVVYDDGHLVEIAVFEPGELHVCRVNAFRVLHDTGDVAAWITALASTTTASPGRGRPRRHRAVRRVRAADDRRHQPQRPRRARLGQRPRARPGARTAAVARPRPRPGRNPTRRSTTSTRTGASSSPTRRSVAGWSRRWTVRSTP